MAAVFVRLERAAQVAFLLGGSAEFQSERRGALRRVILVRIVRFARVALGRAITAQGVFLVTCAFGRLGAFVAALLVGERVAGAIRVRAADEEQRSGEEHCDRRKSGVHGDHP
jgi:hypothetical protein